MPQIGPSGAAGGVFTLRYILRRPLIAEAFVDKIQNHSFTRPGIFKFRQIPAGKHRETLGAAFRDRQNHFIGKSCQAQSLRFSGPKSQLIEPRELDDGLLGRPGRKQISDRLASRERLLAAPCKLNQLDAGRIRQAASSRLALTG